MNFHTAISVDIDRFPDGKLFAEYGPIFAKAGATCAEDIRRMCRQARGRGLDVFPPCDHVDARGHCAGHLEEEP